MKSVVLIVLALCLCLVVTGCSKNSAVVEFLNPPQTKPAPVKVTYENGTIVSNGAIMVEKYSYTMEGGFKCPGVIVKLDTGEVVQIQLDSSVPATLKGYRISYGERVRCETSSARTDWRLTSMQTSIEK